MTDLGERSPVARRDRSLVAQIRFSLLVPPKSHCRNHYLLEGPRRWRFSEGPHHLVDRIWAETCYMKWWLMLGDKAGKDATFFTDEAFDFEGLLEEFDRAATDLARRKSGEIIED